MNRDRELAAFNRLLDVMDELREKCPWDRKQTFESLRPQTIEETFELSDALLNNDIKNISKELGDVLLHIVFYAKIGTEQGLFGITEVIDQLCDKLIYRHPHVFGDVAADSAEQVVKNWEQIKQTEKDGNKTVLSGVPKSLPPLLKSYRIQDKARAVGFDWEHREDVWDKVSEELDEFKAELLALDGSESARLMAQGELGDLLFSIVNASRLYDLNPDSALESTCDKFIRRFGYVEAKAREQGIALKDMTLEQMDAYWNEAKE